MATEGDVADAAAVVDDDAVVAAAVAGDGSTLPRGTEK